MAIPLYIVFTDTAIVVCFPAFSASQLVMFHKVCIAPSGSYGSISVAAGFFIPADIAKGLAKREDDRNARIAEALDEVDAHLVELKLLIDEVEKHTSLLTDAEKSNYKMVLDYFNNVSKFPDSRKAGHRTHIKDRIADIRKIHNRSDISAAISAAKAAAISAAKAAASAAAPPPAAAKGSMALPATISRN
jgi:enamine deaminase RidA (YjgF/YER057c/UK114 family)